MLNNTGWDTHTEITPSTGSKNIGLLAEGANATLATVLETVRANAGR